jgi:hypothetical protein
MASLIWSANFCASGVVKTILLYGWPGAFTKVIDTDGWFERQSAKVQPPSFLETPPAVLFARQ